jgi:hypothetical protein
VFWGLRQLDGPTARYLRTITTPEGGGTLTVPWMAFVSHAGNWIGDGDSLSWVTRVVGSRGHFEYDSSAGTVYSWPNTSRSRTYVWFVNGAADWFAWYTS